MVILVWDTAQSLIVQASSHLVFEFSDARVHMQGFQTIYDAFILQMDISCHL